MLKIDNINKKIFMTRGDDVGLVFSAKDEEGNEFHPTHNDRLIFSVVKKWGEDPLIVITNRMETSEADFWTVNIKPEHTKDLPFKTFKFDVQIEERDGVTDEKKFVDTIIGKTDEVDPKFILWGEASE